MTNYNIGARLERLWCNQMKLRGYKTMRSAGSKGLIDCVAWNENEILFVQVKNGKRAYNDDDIAGLMDMPRPAGVKVFLIVRDGTNGNEWDWIPC